VKTTESRLLICAECGQESDARACRWKAYRVELEEIDEPPAVAFFCPDCDLREFAPGRRASGL
jgi:hypothetical protein